MDDCIHLCQNSLTNCSVEFIRRQTNEVAHILARVTTYRVSFRSYIEIPRCITDLISY